MLYRQSMMLSGEPLDIAVQATRMLSEQYRVKAVSIARIHGDELYFWILCLHGEVHLNAGYGALNDTPHAAVAASREICIYDEAATRFPNAVLLQQHSIIGYCGIPAPDKSGNIAAVISLLDDKAQTFSAGDIEFLQYLGQRIGLEIERQALQDQRDKALAATEARERHYRLILNGARNGILSIDTGGRIDTFNPAAGAILGYRPAEAIGMDAATLLGSCGIDLNALTAMARQNGSAIGHEAIIRKKDGSILSAELSVTSTPLLAQWMHVVIIRDISDRKLKEKQLAGVIRDISDTKQVLTELQRARDEAEQANRAKSVFLAAMSHEIRTPMNGVIGMIDVLKQTPLTFTQTGIVKTIHDSAFMLLRVIDDILDFSKIEAGKLEIAPEAVSIGHLLQSICDTMAPLADRQNVQLQLSIDPALPPSICADPVRMRQIFYNLVSNAVKFSGGRPDCRGEVFIEAESYMADDFPQLRIRISDNGIGMAPETLGRLFSPFVQADSATTRRYGGSGLGLSICRRLVELMNGRIAVDSELGRGSAFTVVLPLEIGTSVQICRSGSEPLHSTSAAAPGANDEDNAEAIVATPNIEAAHREGRLILVAEDNDINRKVMVHQLASLGYAAETAQNGREALQLWRKKAYALLFSDLHMPEMDGYELAAAIRREENGRHKPIIAFTANAIKGENTLCFEAGMDDYLTKPVNMRLLKAILAKWLPLPDAEPSNSLSATAPVDTGMLKTLVGDDAATLDEFLRDYAVAARIAAAELQQAITERDADRIRTVAHRFKSASYAVGARELGDICETLERTGRTAGWNAIETLLRRFTLLEADVQSCIKRLMENSQ